MTDITWISFLLIVIASLLLPKWLLLIFFVPLFMVTSFNNILPPLFSIGDADIQTFDPILIAVAIRVAGPILLRKQQLHFYPQYPSVAIFLCVLLGATIASYFRFGEEIFISEIISYIRLLTQISVFFLFPYSIRTTEELLLARKMFDYVGYAVASTVYLSFVVFGIGMELGEVQSSEEIVRYFGFIGDQVGFIILFFIFKKIIDRSWIGTVFLAGALFATGTRGAFVALSVGLVIILVQMRSQLSLSRRKMGILIMVLTIFVSIMVVQDFGGSRSRFLGYHLETGLTQRLVTMKLAGVMFIDNIIAGVGYTGFRHLALDYGAWHEFSSLLYFSPKFIATAGNQFLQAATDAGILGLVSFGYMSIVFLRTLKKAAKTTVKQTQNDMSAGYVWLLSLLFGNLTAAWLLPSSLISYFLWIILGFAVLSEKNLPIANRNSVALGLHSKSVRTQR